MKNIFFDFDGTIANSQEGTIKALESMAETLGLTKLDTETYKKFIGPALTDSLAKFYPDFPASRYPEAIKVYQAYYNTKGLHQLVLYPQITDILSALKDDGYNLYISSTKPETLIKDLVDYLKLTPYFDGLFGASDDQKTRINKPEILKYGMEIIHADPEQTVIIGDRATDVQGGIANHVHTIGVTYGFGDYHELDQAGAESILEDPTEIPSEIRAFD